MALADDRDSPIDIFQGGFGSEASSLLLYQSRVAGHSSFAAPHHFDKRTEVPIECADVFLGQHGCSLLDALVLDVEGWELHVLRGLESTLRRSIGLRVCIELSTWALAEARTTPQEVLAWLGTRGIDLRHLAGDDWANHSE